MLPCIIFYLIGIILALIITRYENKYRYITKDSGIDYTTPIESLHLALLSWVVPIIFITVLVAVKTKKYMKLPLKFKQWYEGK